MLCQHSCDLLTPQAAMQGPQTGQERLGAEAIEARMGS